MAGVARRVGWLFSLALARLASYRVKAFGKAAVFKKILLEPF
jgi:hypothetical protein